MNEMGGAGSVFGAVAMSVGKDVLETIAIAPGADRLARSAVVELSQLGMGAGMAYGAVNSQWEMVNNYGDGNYVKGTAEGLNNAWSAAQYAGRLSGATGRWATKAIPLMWVYDIGKIGAFGFIAYKGQSWHNQEFDRILQSWKSSDYNELQSLFDMEDIMAQMEKEGCI